MTERPIPWIRIAAGGALLTTLASAPGPARLDRVSAVAESAGISAPGRADDLRSVAPIDVEFRFALLAERWHRETDGLSSPTYKAEHPDYQAIIAMGRRAVPLILSDLERHEGGDWYVALRRILGTSPVRRGDNVNSAGVLSRWIEWAKGEGLYSERRLVA